MLLIKGNTLSGKKVTLSREKANQSLRGYYNAMKNI